MGAAFACAGRCRAVCTVKPCSRDETPFPLGDRGANTLDVFPFSLSVLSRPCGASDRTRLSRSDRWIGDVVRGRVRVGEGNGAQIARAGERKLRDLHRRTSSVRPSQPRERE